MAPLLNGSFAHRLICAFFGIHLAHLAQASFLAFPELFCSGLRLLGSLALIYPLANFGSLAHFGLIGSSAPLASFAHWLLGSLAHWLICAILGISRALLLWPQVHWLLGPPLLVGSFAHLLII